MSGWQANEDHIDLNIFGITEVSECWQVYSQMGRLTQWISIAPTGFSVDIETLPYKGI